MVNESVYRIVHSYEMLRKSVVYYGLACNEMPGPIKSNYLNDRKMPPKLIKWTKYMKSKRNLTNYF